MNWNHRLLGAVIITACALRPAFAASAGSPLEQLKRAAAAGEAVGTVIDGGAVHPTLASAVAVLPAESAKAALEKALAEYGTKRQSDIASVRQYQTELFRIRFKTLIGDTLGGGLAPETTEVLLSRLDTFRIHWAETQGNLGAAEFNCPDNWLCRPGYLESYNHVVGARTREMLQAALTHRDRFSLPMRGDARLVVASDPANDRVVAAVYKLVREGGADADTFFLRPFANQDPGSLLVTVEMAKEYYKQAWGAVPETELPRRLRGLDTKAVIGLLKDWLGPDGIGAFQDKLSVGSGEATNVFYNLPMLDLWVGENAGYLRRVLDPKWTRLSGIDRSFLLAVKETAARRKVRVDSILTATPTSLYVPLELLPEVMQYYRQNKKAAAADDLIAEVAKFRVDLIGELKNVQATLQALDSRKQLDLLTQAVNNNTAAVRQVGAEVGGVRWAVNLGTLVNILLHVL